MKVLLYGRYGNYPKEVEDVVKEYGFEIVTEDPETVITYGGDGTLIGAERDYPRIPKLPLKNSDRCLLCATIPNNEMLQLLKEKKLKTKEYSKLEATIGTKAILATNDIVIRNAQPNTALRFEVKVNDQSLGHFVGDGVVITTPVGSTGYYYSITRQSISDGIGLAFNNIHNQDPINKNLSATDQIEVLVTRGPGVLAVDNNPETISLKKDCRISIKTSNQKMNLLFP